MINNNWVMFKFLKLIKQIKFKPHQLEHTPLTLCRERLHHNLPIYKRLKYVYIYIYIYTFTEVLLNNIPYFSFMDGQQISKPSFLLIGI